MLTKRLLKNLNLTVPQLSFSVLLGFLMASCGIGLTALSGWLIIRSWQRPTMFDLTIAITSVRALGIGRAVFRYIDRLYAHNIIFRAFTESKVTLYQQLTSTNSLTSPQVTERMKELENTIFSIVQGYIPTITAGCIAVGAVLTMAYYSPHVALIEGLGFVVIGGIFLWTWRRLFQQHTSDSLGDIHHHYVRLLKQTITYRDEFLVHGLLADKIAETSALLRQWTVKKTSIMGGQPTIQLAIGLAQGSLIVTTIIALSELIPRYGQASCGIVLLLPLAVYESLAVLPSFLENLLKFPHQRESVLSASNGLTPTADHSAVLLSKITDTLRLSPVIVVTGPNGSGKTTLLHTMHQRNEQSHFFGARDHIFFTSVTENVAIAAPADRHLPIRQVLHDVNLDQWLHTLSAQENTIIQHGQLSSGQQRKISFARFLSSSQPLLLIDEPTENIDRDTSQRLAELLLQHRDSTRTVIATHDPLVINQAKHMSIPIIDLGN